MKYIVLNLETGKVLRLNLHRLETATLLTQYLGENWVVGLEDENIQEGVN